jgi:hypothetical protein
MSAEPIGRAAQMTDAPSVTITRDDLEIVAEAMMLRFHLRGSESRRVARMREQLATASELCRALNTHTHHALVHCQGSHGTGDLQADTAALYDALASFALLVHEVAGEYRATVREAAVPRPIEEPLLVGGRRERAAVT